MKVVFLGTPDFSVEPFKAVCAKKGVEVTAAVCNCDKPFGRKRILTPPPVKVAALERQIPVYQYEKIKNEGVQDLKSLAPDLMITCAFGQILSQEILDIPKYGVINIHASLLPKYRGASPVQACILNGDSKTGITVMQTEIGIDTGNIIYSEEITVGENENAGELFSRLSSLGAKCINVVLDMFLSGKVKSIPQNDSEASLTKMIKKEDAYIDFCSDATTTVNKVRAYNPSPVAYTLFNGEPFKIYKAEKSDLTGGECGVVIKSDTELIVGCKNGAVKLCEVQKSGGKRMNVKEFLKGNKIYVGDKFGK